MQEQKDKAIELYEKLSEAQENMRKLAKAKSFVSELYSVGTELTHIKYGKGTISNRDKNNIFVDFAEHGTKKLGLYQSIALDVISVSENRDKETLKECVCIIKKENSISTALSYYEKQFQPYAEYLD